MRTMHWNGHCEIFFVKKFTKTGIFRKKGKKKEGRESKVRDQKEKMTKK